MHMYIWHDEYFPQNYFEYVSTFTVFHNHKYLKKQVIVKLEVNWL